MYIYICIYIYIYTYLFIYLFIYLPLHSRVSETAVAPDWTVLAASLTQATGKLNHF